MRVKDVMQAPVITIAAEASLWAARDVMTRAGIRHLPVLRGKAVVGLVTGWDIRRVVRAMGPLPPPRECLALLGRLQVRHVMRQRLAILSPETPAYEAAQRVWEGRDTCFLVMQAGELIGIVTSTDLLDVFLAVLEGQRSTPFEHLLVPTDFGVAAAQALDKGLTLARHCGAALTVLHVLHRLSAMLALDRDHISAEIVTQIVEDSRAAVMTRLVELVPPAASSWVECRVVEGDPTQGIVTVAHQLKADLIIMGRSRRRGLGRLFKRNVTREVGRYAPCPVLVVEGVARYELVHA
jgi:nucleotide-binding universal stress UspA family protein/CBS domain-containing protein